MGRATGHGQAEELDAQPTVRAALAWAIRVLSVAGSETPRLDAEVLLGHLLGRTRAQLWADDGHELAPSEARAFTHLVARRAKHEPVAYLIGSRAFYDLELAVGPGALIPRPETEHLLEEALAWCARHGPGPFWAADVGTGSGALAVALARHVPQARVCAVDLSRAALSVAGRNIARHAVAERVYRIQGDLLSALRGPLALIMANLPYIPRARWGELPPDVAEYEPRLALDGGPDGLDLVRRLLAQAPTRLAHPGLLLLEIDEGQGEETARLAQEALPEATVRVLRDYAGLERVVRVERA